jgi:hypothetical protein
MWSEHVVAAELEALPPMKAQPAAESGDGA